MKNSINKQLTAHGLQLCKAVGCMLLVVSLFGCGQSKDSSPQPDYTNFTLSGKVGNISVSGIKSSSILPVTHIVAIGSDNNKYLATYDSTAGTFSVRIIKGMPYALGFYNQSGGKITLLGYFKQNEVNWHSLPLMYTTGDSANVGTMEINATSVEAVPAMDLSSLLSETSMDLASANLYGTVDGVMTLFTNVDVDNNGVFDFQEDKGYGLQISIGTGLSSTEGLASGEVTKMLNQYNETYYPVPNAYQIIFHAKDSPAPSNDTSGTVKFPIAIKGNNGISKTQLTGSVWGSTGDFWSFMSSEDLAQGELIDPTVVPTGSYTFEVSGKGTYTFQNVQGAPIAAVGTSEGIIYPVFKMVTNEAGYVTTIYVKWMMTTGVRSSRAATDTEVKAILVDADLNTPNLIEPSPTIGVTLGPYSPTVEVDPINYRPPLKFKLTDSSIDVSNWSNQDGSSVGVKFSDIGMFQCGYKLNSNISLLFMFLK